MYLITPVLIQYIVFFSSVFPALTARCARNGNSKKSELVFPLSFITPLYRVDDSGRTLFKVFKTLLAIWGTPLHAEASR